MKTILGWVSLFLFMASPSAVWAGTGMAILQATGSVALSGNVLFEETQKGLKITGHFLDVPPGKHGFHIHQFGTCGDGGKAAGSHYNPADVSHGDLLREGFTKAHAGDLGNIEVGPDGKVQFEKVVPGLTLSGGKYNIAGRAVVLHEKVDNFGQPVGNAGGRIGCGPIVITGQ